MGGRWREEGGGAVACQIAVIFPAVNCMPVDMENCTAYC